MDAEYGPSDLAPPLLSPASVSDTAPEGGDKVILELLTEPEIDLTPPLPPASASDTAPEGGDAVILQVTEPEIALAPLSPASDTASEGGDAIVPVTEPVPEIIDMDISAYEEFIIKGLKDQMQANEPNNIIRKVPDRLREGKNNNAYEPNIISIGPFHRGTPRLQAMEKRKVQSLIETLSKNPDVSLKDMVRNLRRLEDRVRRCYSVENHLETLDSKEFVKMMVLDSCFVLHLILQVIDDAKDMDGMTWIGPLIVYDLLLLENQLPFFLVQSMFDITNREGKYPSSQLAVIAYYFYCHVTREKFQIEHMYFPPADQVHHLLQLYHWFSICPLVNRSAAKIPKSKWGCSTLNKYYFHVLKSLLLQGGGEEEYQEDESSIMIPNAAVLHDSGIKFRKKNKADSILDVKFSNGVLEIPPLVIHDGTVSLFMNLIAFEQCCDFYLSNLPQFAVYLKFMDHIINTATDVVLLQNNGIIVHTYGSETEVAHLFNRITRGATINSNNRLSGLYKEVNSYCKKRRHIWRTIFLKRHCRNPWTICSLLGVLILLALTFIQSYFSVYSYFQPPHQPTGTP